MLDVIIQDIRYAIRGLSSTPGFAAVAILSLTLGIGANTAMFTVIHAVLLKPLEYREPDRLVELSLANSRKLDTFTPVRYEELKAAVRPFMELGALGFDQNMTLTGNSEPEKITAVRVSANFLNILGVTPSVGRGFIPEEDKPGGQPVAMLSTRLWQSRFQGDPLIAGKKVILDSVVYTVVGVLPSGFPFPSTGVDVWLPRPSEWSGVLAQYWFRTATLTGFARLGPQVGIQQAAAVLNALNHQYIVAHPEMPDANPSTIMRVAGLANRPVAGVRSMLWLLFGAVGFVLLIACVNLASLVLAKATSRSHEFVVRAALGATRGRLIAQLLVESLLLAFAGGAQGVFLARVGLAAISKMSAFHLPRSGEIRQDGTVLGFTVALSLITAVLFGLFPSLQVSRPDLANALRVSAEGAGFGPARRRLVWSRIRFTNRGLLVIGQVALSIVLLIGAALLIKSLARLRSVDPGFQTANLLAMQIALPPTHYAGQKRVAFFEGVVDRVKALPGVHDATVALTLPTMPFQLTTVQVSERPAVAFTQRPSVEQQTVVGDYFGTLGVPLRRGRVFTEHDLKNGPPVLVINETLARHFWPEYPLGRDPLGQHLQLGTYAVEIVGIAQDVRESLAFDAPPEVYFPARFSPPQTAYLVVRTGGDPRQYIKIVRSQVAAIDRNLAVSQVKTMDDLFDASLGQQLLTMTLLTSFSCMGLLLVVVGIYGVIAYSVVQRTQEFGIRRALGAQNTDILALVVREGLSLTLIGIALGVGGALALTRVMRSLLFHVSATDPVIFAAMAILLVVVGVAASLIPASSASRIDPMAALR
jgi:putative ABC transport system permease protein